jgi:hypothetical protein
MCRSESDHRDDKVFIHVIALQEGSQWASVWRGGTRGMKQRSRSRAPHALAYISWFFINVVTQERIFLTPKSSSGTLFEP